MHKEETENTFFSRLKHMFSGAEKQAQQGTAVNDNNEVIVETTGGNDPVVEVYTYTKPESNLDGIVRNNEEPLDQLQTPYTEKSFTEQREELLVRTVEVTVPEFPISEEKDLDIRFATKFLESGGKFIYCETIADVIENLRLLKQEMGWSHVFSWENEIKDAFCDYGFQKGALGFTIENSDAAMSLCESLIADEGSIVLNPKQASRRRLPCFPKTHILLTDISRLVPGETEALDRFNLVHKGELPSIAKLGQCNNGHFYDKQRLILNAEGTEDIYVFLVDQRIPPSTRL
jgi:L-lactate dehydrogenase complex protein LldG